MDSEDDICILHPSLDEIDNIEIDGGVTSGPFLPFFAVSAPCNHDAHYALLHAYKELKQRLSETNAQKRYLSRRVEELESRKNFVDSSSSGSETFELMDDNSLQRRLPAVSRQWGAGEALRAMDDNSSVQRRPARVSTMKVVDSEKGEANPEVNLAEQKWYCAFLDERRQKETVLRSLLELQAKYERLQEQDKEKTAQIKELQDRENDSLKFESCQNQHIDREMMRSLGAIERLRNQVKAQTEFLKSKGFTPELMLKSQSAQRTSSWVENSFPGNGSNEESISGGNSWEMVNSSSQQQQQQQLRKLQFMTRKQHELLLPQHQPNCPMKTKEETGQQRAPLVKTTYQQKSSKPSSLESSLHSDNSRLLVVNGTGDTGKGSASSPPRQGSSLERSDPRTDGLHRRRSDEDKSSKPSSLKNSLHSDYSRPLVVNGAGDAEKGSAPSPPRQRSSLERPDPRTDNLQGRRVDDDVTSQAPNKPEVFRTQPVPQSSQLCGWTKRFTGPDQQAHHGGALPVIRGASEKPGLYPSTPLGKPQQLNPDENVCPRWPNTGPHMQILNQKSMSGARVIVENSSGDHSNAGAIPIVHDTSGLHVSNVRGSTPETAELSTAAPDPTDLQISECRGEDKCLCPVCGQDYSHVSMDEFQQHVFDCFDKIDDSNGPETLQPTYSDQTSTSSSNRTCPMCQKPFADDVSQSYFENHVQSHFEEIVDHFEVLDMGRS